MLYVNSKRACKRIVFVVKVTPAWKGAVQMVTSKRAIQHIFRSVLICTERMWKAGRC